MAGFETGFEGEMMRKLWIGAAMVLAGCSIGKDVPVAEAEAKRFHAMLDAGQFAEIYRAGTPEFHALKSQEDMMALLDAVHRKLGKFQSAATSGWNDNFDNRNHYIVLNQQAKYARGEAAETFTYQIRDGRALLTEYQVASKAAALN